eukprot:SAG31_NODE_2598_length_5417_cov_16.893005_5_plen_381_part_01
MLKIILETSKVSAKEDEKRRKLANRQVNVGEKLVFQSPTTSKVVATAEREACATKSSPDAVPLNQASEQTALHPQRNSIAAQREKLMPPGSVHAKARAAEQNELATGVPYFAVQRHTSTTDVPKQAQEPFADGYTDTAGPEWIRPQLTVGRDATAMQARVDTSDDSDDMFNVDMVFGGELATAGSSVRWSTSTSGSQHSITTEGGLQETANLLSQDSQILLQAEDIAESKVSPPPTVIRPANTEGQTFTPVPYYEDVKRQSVAGPQPKSQGCRTGESDNDRSVLKQSSLHPIHPSPATVDNKNTKHAHNKKTVHIHQSNFTNQTPARPQVRGERVASMFSTGTGKAVHVSKASLDRAHRMMEAEDESMAAEAGASSAVAAA